MQALAVATFLAGARCEPDITRQLEEWHARVEEVFADAPDPTGTRSVRISTDELGVWVRLSVDRRGEALLERVTAAAIEALRFSPSCARVDEGRRERSIAPDGWTDAALAERLRRGDTGVILLWSPHMPLSVDAVVVLRSLTEEMGFALVAMIDPAADRAYAQSVGRERGLPSSALRPLGGIELAFRGMTTHAPSIQLFEAGRLVGPVLFGYRDRAGFRQAIERVLG